MTMNIYVDLGCYDGDSINEFIASHENEISDWMIYGFDPNPRFQPQWDEIEKEYKKVQISNEAAWIESGKVLYNLMPEDRPLGSSIMKEKRDWGKGDVIEVYSFDFSSWLKANVTKDDYVIVKFDIEGSEYPILEKMIKDKTHLLVDEMWLEHHAHKMPVGDWEAKRDEIMESLNAEDITIKSW